MFIPEKLNMISILERQYMILSSPGKPSQLVPVGGDQSFKRMTHYDELHGLFVNLLPELESGRGREQVGDSFMQVPLLGVGGAVGELEVVNEPRGRGRLEDWAVEEPLGNRPPE